MFTPRIVTFARAAAATKRTPRAALSTYATTRISCLSCPTSNRTRTFTTTSPTSYPKPELSDKNAINTESTEYTKSGTDNSSAQQDEAAFEPGRTSPEEEHAKAGEGNEENPLDVSPANQEISNPQKSTETENAPSEGENGGGNGGRDRTSGGGSPRKGKKVA